jgi:hypothetical protein
VVSPEEGRKTAPVYAYTSNVVQQTQQTVLHRAAVLCADPGLCVLNLDMGSLGSGVDVLHSVRECWRNLSLSLSLFSYVCIYVVLYGVFGVLR